MNKNIIKKISATSAITFGIVFLITTFPEIWGIHYDYELEKLMSSIMGTCGVMSAGFIALLVVMKLVEDKK